MSARRSVLWLLGLLFAAGAQAAPDRDASARIDDFAVPPAAGSSGVRMEQLSDTGPQMPAEIAEPDRAIAVPPRSEQAGSPTEQLSRDVGNGPPTQLSSSAQSRDYETAAVSSKADSAPGTVVRIKGSDRCDPQLAQHLLARCLRILELRASEFNAPAPPQLSAEQKILAEQREREDNLADRSTNLRIRYATMTEPDADLQSNQELASIYLADQPGGPIREPDEPAAQEPSGLQAILGAMGLEAPPSEGQ